MDVTRDIEPRSDQQNFEDYAAGPRTVTVTGADRDGEGRVAVHLAEYPGRPFKPSKTNLRLIVTGWGGDTDAWVGRRMTLAGDPTVRFGGKTVGGIRVTALSDIDGPFTANLSATRGKRVPYKVDKLAAAPTPPPIPAFGSADEARAYWVQRRDAGASTDELTAIQQAAAATPTNTKEND